MENLAYIYTLIVFLTAIEIVGLALKISILRNTHWFCTSWATISVVLTLVIFVVSIFELYFIGVSNLSGILLLFSPLVICVMISWFSVANNASQS